MCLSDGNAMIQYSAEWGPCINCYQCEMCFSTRCQLTINDSDRKTEVGRGQPFFPPFFFRILPSDYRTADCLHSCFFFLAVVILSPFPPRFCSFQVKLCNGGPAPTTEGLSAASDCARYLMPAQVVTHSDGMERTDKRQR